MNEAVLVNREKLLQLIADAQIDYSEVQVQFEDEEDLWRAEMQEAGVPEPMQDDLVNLLKEIHGALGAGGWSDPKHEAALLAKRLAHYKFRFEMHAFAKDARPRIISTDDQIIEAVRKNASEGKC